MTDSEDDLRTGRKSGDPFEENAASTNESLKEDLDNGKKKTRQQEQAKEKRAGAAKKAERLFFSPSGTEKRKDSVALEDELRGKTLKTYLFMMKNAKPIGVRELQRSLALSSPSVAYHHLEKLERMGLVTKDQYSEYVIVKNVDVGVLQAFTQVGRLLLPRFIFYAMFFTTLLVGYILIYLQNSNLFVLAFGVSASVFAWYETFRTWVKRPF